MSVQLNFDASTVEPQQAFEAIPAGDYIAALTAAEGKPTKNNDGHYLRCDFTILDGPYKGRHIFETLNLWNKSKQATEIAWRQMSALCHATGVIQVGEVSQLYGIPFSLKVGTESDDTYGLTNFVRGYSRSVTAPGLGGFGPPAGGFAPTPPAQYTPPAPPPEAPDASAPWNQPKQAAAPQAPAPTAAGATTPPPWATTAAPAAAPSPGAPVADTPPWAR